MNRPEYIIGIDPDTDKSGVALLEVSTRRIIVDALTFPKIIRYLHNAADSRPRDRTVVVVEASWTTAHNFHLLPTDSKAVAAKKNYHVGCNHQMGKCIAMAAEDYGLHVALQPPLRKLWKGKDRKITHEEIIAVTGADIRRTNQEVRDAMLLAWYYSGLPIKLR